MRGTVEPHGSRPSPAGLSSPAEGTKAARSSGPEGSEWCRGPGQGWKTGKLSKARECGVRRGHDGAWKSWGVRLGDRQTGGD